MTHAPPLVSTLAIALVLAFAFGVLAQRLRMPPLVGYLLAGVALGPFTPGMIADQSIANELAEVGIILLMFGVGLHFSLEDLLSVRSIAVSGALLQALVSIPLGMGLAWWEGWSLGAGIIFGIALSVASTVVVLRVLQERRLLESERGRVAVGWLVVQDLAMVLVLVLLPPLTGMLKGNLGAAPDPAVLVASVGLTLAKVAAFILVMLLVGKKLIPALLHYVAHTGSRELFRLAVLSVALGFALIATELFGVSLALGAFFAGMILSESRLSQQAATESLPLRDAFAVLFFVSVGMLFNPKVLTEAPVALAVTVLIIMLGKSLAAYGVMRAFGYVRGAALTVTASLAQIGEFSFILAGIGIGSALLPEAARDLILAAAIISIVLNPALFAAADFVIARAERRLAKTDGPAREAATREPIRPTKLSGHVVLVGHGRVGSFISRALLERDVPIFVIEDNAEAVADLKRHQIEALRGNAADPELIAVANLGAARCLLVAIPNAFEGGQVVQQAKAINPKLLIIARAHSEAEIQHLERHGADRVVMAEHEIAKAMLEGLRAATAASPADTAGPEVGRDRKAVPSLETESP